jgi:hypothetical protein
VVNIPIVILLAGAVVRLRAADTGTDRGVPRSRTSGC